MEKEEFRELTKNIEKAKKIRSEMYSLWCTELYRLSIANMVNSHLKHILLHYINSLKVEYLISYSYYFSLSIATKSYGFRIV